MINFCKLIILGFISMFLITNCISSTTTIANHAKIKTVASWHISLIYERGEVVPNPTNDLQLRDEIYYCLKYKYSIPVVRDRSSADGYIRIHPVHFDVGGFKSLEVILYDAGENKIARIQFKNGKDKPIWKDDEFTEYCAKTIAELILEEKAGD